MKPFFSIIVPCCNVAKYLRECLDSIVGQSFRDWECIIGVETSDDGTEEIVRGYEARDGRIRVFSGPRSGGCSATRNKGFAAAAGEYVICVDGDDSIAEGSLQCIHDAIAERPGADLYPCAIRVYNELLRQEEPKRPLRPRYCGPRSQRKSVRFKKGNSSFTPLFARAATMFLRVLPMKSSFISKRWRSVSRWSCRAAT